MLREIKETSKFLQKKTGNRPEVGIVLGTGLGGLVNDIDIEFKINYNSIPNFPVSTVEGHEGQMIFGTLSGKPVVAMQGRFHYYEGYSMQEVTFPVRVMKMLGVKFLIFSNASGGVNPEFEVGDIMFIRDHINLLPNPLIGKNIEELGPRFPDLSEAYDKSILRKATDVALKHGIKHHTGIYASVSGPTFETPAEYHFIRLLGADCVGMSTVPEVIAARHMNLKCFAVSVVSDLGVEGKIVEVTHEDVIDAASHVEPKMTMIIKDLLLQPDLY